MNKHVAVIITAWNQLEKTMACLETVIAQEYLKFDIILIDNGSDPPLAPFIIPRFPQVEIIRNTTNIGFVRGYNCGLKRAIAQGLIIFFY